MKSHEKVLGLLYDRRDGCYSPEELCLAAGLDRRRLATAMETLRQRGHDLQVSPAQGVQLARPVRLEACLIERALGTRRVGRNAICFQEVDSTNDTAFSSASQSGADGLVVLAESQRKGRGRHGRRWLSPPGANILMSVLLVEKAADAPLSHEALTIATGLAVAEGIDAACGVNCRLKWPNDVLIDQAKAAGVLVEIRSTAGAKRAIVLGIGINVNAAPDDLPAACLADQAGHAVERTEVVRGVLRRLDEWLEHVAHGRLQALHNAWVARCGMINQRLTVLSSQRRYCGRVLDVSPLEGLILLCDDGRRVHLPARTSTTDTA